MWPKAFAQLIELAPHISRLVPMADRFFQSKAATEEANRRAVETMVGGIRDDFEQVTAAQAALSRQMAEHGDRISAIATDIATLKRDSDGSRLAAFEERLTLLQARAQLQATLSVVIIVLLVAALVLLGRVYARL